jgi:hypothetical protein
MHIHHPRIVSALAVISCLFALSAGSAGLLGQVSSFQTPYVTRAEAVMVLLQARIPKIPALQSKGEFVDVVKGAWYERYILVAERLQILQANPVTHRIRPEDPVTRAEFLAMAARTFGVNTLLFSSTYKDVSAVMTVRGVASGGSRTKPLSIRFLVLSDTSYCNDSPEANTFSIPALRKEYVQQSTTLQGINRGSLTFDGDATLLGFGGHIHAWEGGNALAVYLNNNLLQLITPHQAGAEPWSWKTAPVDRAVPMKKGDTISLTATYENPNVVPTRGAMGIVGLIFWQPSKEAELLAPYKQTTATTTLDRYGTF